MSGGFFRGTSADQDTRFSNKQAKLMKSQKFAPELDHLVDIAKVKMDVIKPWIANRVTELLGFEDEVLINFIYTLLDGKEVNGKEIQISLTGFMEKNTGKFMKELWTLLLSAQKNASSVPQQFLDAKEEEIRKKKEEADRIANEIQKKREKETSEFELDRLKKMDGGAEQVANSVLDANLKNVIPRVSSDHFAAEKENETLNGKRERRRRTPSRSFSQSLSNSRSNSGRTPSRSFSQSLSNSRSNSGDGNQGRSLSRSPEERCRKLHHSPFRRSITPHRRDPRESLLPRRRSPFARRRSRSPFRRRSPSPLRRRLHSPFYRRSRSPVRRRSPSLVRRHRSPTPVRRRRMPSPTRRGRTPSPVRRGRSPSPTRRGRSPSALKRRRSPSLVRQRRSPSPLRRRRSPPHLRRHRSPSPIRRRMSLSPTRHRSPLARRPRSPSSEEYRSLSPMQRQSRSPVQRRYHRSPPTPLRKSPSSTTLDKSPSPMRRKATIPLSRKSTLSPPRSSSPNGSPSSAGLEISSPEQRTSSKHQRSSVQSPNQLRSSRMSSPGVTRQSSPLWPSKREQKDRSQSQRRNQATSFVVEKSSDLPGSSAGDRRKAGEGQRSSSHSESPVDLARERMIQIDELSKKPRGKAHQSSLEQNKEHMNARSSQKTYIKPFAVGSLKYSNANVDHKENSPETFLGNQSTDSQTHFDVKGLRKNDVELKSERKAPGDLKVPSQYKDSLQVDGQQGYFKSNEGKNSNEKNQSHSNKVKDGGGNRSILAALSAEKAIHEEQSDVFTSDSEHEGKSRNRDVEKRKHKRRRKVASASDYGSDSGQEERTEAKRRKKEERRLRKEKKRQRREKRRHRREEIDADKLKAKNHRGEYSSDDKHATRKKSHAIDEEKSELEQKKLEKELREKALESFKAKRGING